jgi:hypothetical protein
MADASITGHITHRIAPPTELQTGLKGLIEIGLALTGFEANNTGKRDKNMMSPLKNLVVALFSVPILRELMHFYPPHCL